jgi:hypothetical protein
MSGEIQVTDGVGGHQPSFSILFDMAVHAFFGYRSYRG